MAAIEYKEYYREKLEAGLEYQDFVMDQLMNIGISLNCYSSKKYQFNKGESRSGIEIKFDNLRKTTHNLYIEYAEKSNANNISYVSSGIMRNDNTWLYVIGDRDVIYILPKAWLIQFKNLPDTIHKKTPTSKGYLFPEILANKYAAKVIRL